MIVPAALVFNNFVVIAIVLATLYFSRDILVPIVLAVLISFVLAPLVRFSRVGICRVRWPFFLQWRARSSSPFH